MEPMTEELFGHISPRKIPKAAIIADRRCGEPADEHPASATELNTPRNIKRFIIAFERLIGQTIRYYRDSHHTNQLAQIICRVIFSSDIISEYHHHPFLC